MASITLLKRFATYALPGAAVIAWMTWLSTAQVTKPANGPAGGGHASEPANPCGNAISILNEGKVYEAFDKLNGGGDKRLRFRLDGKEPCGAGGCTTKGKTETRAQGAFESQPVHNADGNVATKPEGDAAGKPADKTEDAAEAKPEGSAVAKQEATPAAKVATKVEVVSRTAAAEKVIAAIELTGRSATYCLYGASRVDTTPAQRRNGCPPHYLQNFLAIKLADGNGPFARRDVSIRYVYRADAGAGSLDHCTSPAILDGMFRRRAWTVPLDDGATAYIGETDFPRDRRATVPTDAPFATTVFGERPE